MSEEQYIAVYDVYAPGDGEYGFGGNGRIKVAVTEETEDRIIGRECDMLSPEPYDRRVVFNKDKVAGWSECPYTFEILQMSDEEWEEEMGCTIEEFYG